MFCFKVSIPHEPKGTFAAMTASLTSQPKRLQTRFDVASDDQAQELTAAWEDIESGKRTRISMAAEDTLEIVERALARACVDYLNYDRSGKVEAHQQRLHALSVCMDRDTDDLEMRIREDYLSADGPWTAWSLELSRLSCHERQSLVLTAAQTPA
jgi:hypothetical protein